MFRNEDGIVCAFVKKDRTHVHEDEITIEDPTLVDWQAVIDKTANRKQFVVKNDLTKAVDIEQDIYSKEILGKVGQPAKEESVEENSSGLDIEAMKKEIIAKKNALSPVDKKEMGDKLKAAGLPTAFKNVTDVAVLQKVLDMFQ